MGRLIDGKWHAGWHAPNDEGTFERTKTQFRLRISAEKGAEFPAEAGRYHLYVSYACPWAHRTILTRALRGLEEAVTMTAVDPHMGDDGWIFSESDPDPIFGAKYLREIYVRANAVYSGSVTVPVLWDKKTNQMVNNESREVMRMLDTEMNAFAKNPKVLAPVALREQIDDVLDAIYAPINNGVYRAGFATSQDAYESACKTLFLELEKWEKTLGEHRFTCGSELTEADIAFFTTLIRFDTVYYAHFKCNVHRVQDLPNLWGFLRDIYQRPDVKRNVRLDHIKTHYYWSQNNVNPHRIVPIGPTIDFDAPHDRGRLG